MSSSNGTDEVSGLPRVICGATLRRKPGEVCTQSPLKGRSRCALHGGLSPRGSDSPSYRHGRYSRFATDQLAELIEEYEADERPLDTRDEIAVMRALLADWTIRHEELVDAILAWRKAEVAERGPFARPSRVPDVLDALPFMDAISKAAKRERDTIVQTAVSRAALAAVIRSMRSVVESVLAGEEHDEVREAILAQWREIRI